MKAFKFFKIAILALVLASNVMANEEGLLKDAKVYVGIGPNFGSGALGDLHLGADFAVLRDGDFIVHAGPFVSMPFMPHFFGGDIDVALKASYRVKLSRDMDLVPYGKVFVGPSFSSAGVGFNIGFTPGVEFFFTRHVGIYTELGFVHRSYFGTPSWHLPLGSFNLGLTYRF